MLGGRKMTSTLTGVTLEGSVTKGCPQRGTLTHRGTQWEWQLNTAVYAILINGKFPNYVSQLPQEARSMEQQWCGKTQISIHPQKVQYLDQYLSN